MQRSRAQVALVFLAALLPRAIGLRDFLTTDEAYHWITRTERFAAAIGEGRWADTILTGHPGVTLMWLGGLGLMLERTAVALGLAAPPDTLGHLAWLRLGPALAHALLIPAGFLLLRRLLRPSAALIAALLWATSPFLVAHGRLLHLDALLADLCALTVLAALAACRAARPLPWLALSGTICGLALLTKGPALIVLPFVGLAMVALYGERRAMDEGRGDWSLVIHRWSDAIRWAVPRYLLWLGVAGLVVLALWPALWAAPGRALGSYVGEIVGNGGRANGDGQFFLGRSDADPGALFYPLAGVYRLTPLESIGLLLLPLALWRQPNRDLRASALALAAFALFWALVMTAGPKKFDRYILPAWPAIMALSAIGLASIADCRLQIADWATSAICNLQSAIAVVLLFQGLTLAWYHPYYLSYYNPLLGGGRAAQNIFLIGWGEGMDQVGAWLSARPDIDDGQVLSALPPTLQPFVPVPVQLIDVLGAVPANYAVAYRESIQRGADPERYGRIQTTAPLGTVTIHGIDYAWIYQLPKPFATPAPARFGAGLRLRGYTLAQEPSRLIITPSWDVAGPVGGDVTLFLHLYDARGERVAGIDVPPGGATYPPSGQWRPGQQIAVPLPIDLPAGLPAGAYTITLGLYDPAGGARLPLTEGTPADPAVAGGDALLLGEVTLDAAP
ncbi:glycosyltransferase family 39 protein [Oscillochloris sp. ZM17-4]|uniref:glycosyltransferase family 39 protein n=1 Tax=Oscillochloris sp. ZM17-4 TaxID=2866714 RepID=UPI001C737088|nr:glycosyltransferase family 39 protein [Oscillochloris sp. ZM17-4]MBX0327851.1 glycosyltransferase family 39 protein [Oscillochloris sp. ZM17-4]